MIRLPTLLRKFIRLEVMAAELYRAHIAHVPISLKPMMHHFAKVEEHHRDTFRKIYRDLVGHEAPRENHTKHLMRLVAWGLSLRGSRAILRFECMIEERAIADYTQALTWVEQPEIRRAIHVILEDEKVHGPLIESLKTFRHDEEEHIEKMKEAMKHLENV